MDENWWDDRTMANENEMEWHRDSEGVLWQIDPVTMTRRRYG